LTPFKQAQQKAKNFDKNFLKLICVAKK